MWTLTVRRDVPVSDAERWCGAAWFECCVCHLRRQVRRVEAEAYMAVSHGGVLRITVSWYRRVELF